MANCQKCRRSENVNLTALRSHPWFQWSRLRASSRQKAASCQHTVQPKRSSKLKACTTAPRRVTPASAGACRERQRRAEGGMSSSARLPTSGTAMSPAAVCTRQDPTAQGAASTTSRTLTIASKAKCRGCPLASRGNCGRASRSGPRSIRSPLRMLTPRRSVIFDANPALTRLARSQLLGTQIVDLGQAVAALQAEQDALRTEQCQLRYDIAELTARPPAVRHAPLLHFEAFYPTEARGNAPLLRTELARLRAEIGQLGALLTTAPGPPAQPPPPATVP
uniref:Uncharacterized protein n=1 Tax=Spironucleus salmonicida TaxID=348837 RepID=V6LYP4_9EUKA|eukprot:EST48851.1 Hypothetical protein SS50377_10949 [Spironucleus salmonicida]